MKKIACTFLILLTFSFAFANSKNIVNKNLLGTTLTTYSQKNGDNKNVVLSISYDVSNFCAYSKGISIPTVSEAGGVYKSTRTSSGGGGLAINQSTGQIDRDISNPGTYEVAYTIGTTSAKTTITVTDCK